MVIVRTPQAGANDVVGSVTFREGVAELDEHVHAAELRYFRAAGYTIEEPAEAPEEPKTRGRRAASDDREAAK